MASNEGRKRNWNDSHWHSPKELPTTQDQIGTNRPRSQQQRREETTNDVSRTLETAQIVTVDRLIQAGVAQ
jgi:hypothetical protein